jgi:hypothetical protein
MYLKNVLNKAISSTPSTVLLLKLHKLQFAEGFKDIREIRLRDAKMYVANVESVERNLVGRVRLGRTYTRLPVLLCFRELCDDGDTEQALPGQLNGLLHGGFLFEFNVADTARMSVNGARRNMVDSPYPFDLPLTLSLTIWASLTGPTFSKKAISSLVLSLAANC